MNPIRTIRRLACIVAGLTAAAMAFAAAAPAAFARVPPPPGPLSRFLPCSPTCANRPHTVARAHIHAAVTGGMPGWQITLIAIGAALLAAAVALLLDRAWIARRHATAAVA
jgi:hypothetical protein